VSLHRLILSVAIDLYWQLQLFSDSYSALQVAELKKKQDAQAQLLRQKQKSDEAARRLHEEIQRIKTQKVRFC